MIPKSITYSQKREIQKKRRERMNKGKEECFVITSHTSAGKLTT
jgi:hypothetical protein